MIRTLIISIWFTLSAAVATAQISLDEYVESVVEYSHNIASADAVLESSRAESDIAQVGMLPSLSLSSDANWDVSGNDIGWGVRADISQPIYNGGRYTTLAEQSEYRLLSAESLKDKSVIDVRYSAESAYWALSRAEIYREAMYDYINIVTTLKDVALHRYEEGYTSKSDLLQVESRLSDAEYQLSLAEQRWRIALNNFNVLRGMVPDSSVELLWSILDDYAMPQRAVLTDVVEHHPDYRGSVANRESALLDISLRRAKYLPSLNFGVFGLWQPKVGSGTMLNGGVALSLSTPIFHFGERRKAIRSAESIYRSAELAVDNVVDRIILDESNGWTNLQSTHMRVNSSIQNLEIAKENLDISTYSYREGLATILDVLQAQLSWLQIFQNTISAQYDYAMAISAYRYIVALY